VVSSCWDSDEGSYALVLRGAVFGLVYGAHHLFRRRWILKFSIIQVISSVAPCFLAQNVYLKGFRGIQFFFLALLFDVGNIHN
jgi:hypothetical protein